MKPNRDWKKETENRVNWIKETLAEAGAKGVYLGLSGGKDSAIVGALCKLAVPNVTGIIMPCESNLPEDRQHAYLLAEKFTIRATELDLTEPFKVLANSIESVYKAFGPSLSALAQANIKPRLRMIVLYAMAQSDNCLVAGTGNKSEATMGYFTKWGDGAYDFNPIADLTVAEMFELGRYLGVPEEILTKAPSAGLWEGQTDEAEMGVTYELIDRMIFGEDVPLQASEIINRAHHTTEHKRQLPKTYA